MPFLVGLSFTTGTFMAAATASDALVAIAVPLNTLLLIALAYYSRQHGQKIDAVQLTATHSANAAASAAQVAADAARITKELGGLLRADGPVVLAKPITTDPHAQGGAN